MSYLLLKKQNKINNKMKKFDLMFEKLCMMLNEKEYVEATFVDNVRSLVKILKDSDYIEKNKDVEQVVKEVMAQPDNVKEIVLDTQEQSLPATKLRLKQESDSESFSVTVIELEKPQDQKEFTNSMLETIFEDVIGYIKSIALKGLSPDAAVDQLPQEQGAAAQPGAEGSALPQA
jgi:hypothetical protein